MAAYRKEINTDCSEINSATDEMAVYRKEINPNCSEIDPNREEIRADCSAVIFAEKTDLYY